MMRLFKKKVELDENSEPEDYTVFHITHYKAGSQWVYAVLVEIARERIVIPEVAAAHYTRGDICAGKIYPCVYLTRKQFKAVKRPEKSRGFIVIRDLRDTLVSQYFSVKASHKILNPQMQKTRDRLNEMNLSDGLTLMMNNNVYISANIQKSWLTSRWMRRSELMVKYEDLIADEHAEFNKIFDYCGFDRDDAIRKNAIETHSFEKRTGRKPGQEDTASHHRKGVAGDWKNYFDDRLKEAFKEKYAKLLIKTGYEKDDSW